MKPILSLIFAFIFLSHFQSSGQIPDSDFNNWNTNSVGRLDLQDWITNNLNFSAPTLLQDVGQSGSDYSAKFVSVYDSSVGYYQGGFVQLIEVPFTGTMRPNSLLGNWKTFNPTNSDIVLADVQIYNSSLIEIGSGAKQTPFVGSLSSWTPFSIPITYTSSDSAAFFSIRISWTNFGGNPAGYSNIDDIRFDISTGEAASPNALAGIKIKEVNRGKFRLLGSDNDWANFAFQVYDMSGKIIIENKDSGENNQNSQASIDLTQSPSGIYFCKVFSKSESKTIKLINY
ncbi:MAG: T9SS type A sorting domain-containing protein [Bacteroidetes bacterium]|nr:MAG: T9SS type A sorting domain-containing protein [Bacteroidota bacterium]